MTAFSWTSETWGQPGANVHESSTASWLRDAHAETSGE